MRIRQTVMLFRLSNYVLPIVSHLLVAVFTASLVILSALIEDCFLEITFKGISAMNQRYRVAPMICTMTLEYF